MYKTKILIGISCLMVSLAGCQDAREQAERARAAEREARARAEDQQARAREEKARAQAMMDKMKLQLEVAGQEIQKLRRQVEMLVQERDQTRQQVERAMDEARQARREVEQLRNQLEKRQEARQSREKKIDKKIDQTRGEQQFSLDLLNGLWTQLPHPLLAATILMQEGDNQVKEELKRFEGTWQAVKVIDQKGQAAKEEVVQSTTIEITGTKFVLTLNNAPIEGTFSIEPSKTPKEIDAILPNADPNKKATKLLGIYEWKDGVRRSTFALPGNLRPTTIGELGAVTLEWRKKTD